MPAAACWSLVVPVKRLERAKTRLTGFPAAVRADLALAMALDTVAAALATPSVGLVVVVTNDARAAADLAGLGAVVVPDRPDAGLNAALVHGAGEATRRLPRWGVAALSSDLPALRPAELSSALLLAAGHPSAYVPDESGTGTTLLTAAPGVPLRPAFGAGSADEHTAGGAARLDVPRGSSLRLDVDTAADLDRALALGSGQHLTALAGRLTAHVTDSHP